MVESHTATDDQEQSEGKDNKVDEDTEHPFDLGGSAKAYARGQCHLRRWWIVHFALQRYSVFLFRSFLRSRAFLQIFFDI